MRTVLRRNSTRNASGACKGRPLWLSYAALDALWPEPLPPESPLWLDPRVTVMPHVARRPTVAQLVTEVVANIHSLRAGGKLLQEVDITQGY